MAPQFQFQTLAPRPLARLLAVTLLLTVVLGALLTVALPARAELNYDFKLEKEQVDIYIQKDGSIDIEYAFHFVNYGDLDGVDVGLPNRHYDKDSAQATIDVGGRTYQPAKIRKSPYVDIGLAVEFDSRTRNRIESSGTAFILNFKVNNPHMVYLNELKEGTVGIKFRPTWFDPDFQRSTTRELQARVFFPQGFTNASAAVYLQDHPWDNLTLDNATGLLVAKWTRYEVYPQDQERGGYDVGVGFPKEYVDKYYEHDLWEKLGNFFHALLGLSIICIPILVVALILAGAYYAGDKRARDYFEPKLSVAGAGPRRDLTAVEAAVALERPLEVVATMILFGLIKKGLAEVVSEKEFLRLRKHAKEGDYPYETDYLEAIKGDGYVDRKRLTKALVKLVKATRTKLGGFDYQATKKYYRSVCDNAWRRVKAASTPEEFAQGLDQQNEWLMLDRRYEKRMEREYRDLPYYDNPYDYPYWYYFYHSHPREGGSLRVSPQQMAATYVNRVKSASHNLVTSMKDLGQEVTKVTNPVPVSTGGSGGGGGCACACACACAGGGR